MGHEAIGHSLMENWLLDRFVFWIPLVLSLSVHEWAHAASAKLLGDDTAERMGRLSLNPVHHIDPIGTLILPLLGVPFGWARPVPVNPLRFRADVGMNTGLMLTAAAGPASNLVMALSMAATIGLFTRVVPDLLPAGAISVISTFIVLNVLLAFFNLLPIPPLDGSRIVDSLIPDSLRPTWDVFSQYSAFALVAILFLPLMSGFNVFAWPQNWAMSLLQMAAGQ